MQSPWHAGARSLAKAELCGIILPMNQHFAVFSMRTRPSDDARRKRASLRILLAFSLLWALPALACGSFAPRPTPTTAPLAASVETVEPLFEQVTEVPPTAAPAATLVPTPTNAPAASSAGGLTVGQRASVVAPNGLNLRQSPSTSAEQVIRLSTGQSVDVLSGPTSADGYTWWEIRASDSTQGWAADGDDDTVFLRTEGGAVGGGAGEASAPAAGANAQPVDRAPRVGERVRVTVSQLTIRSSPGENSAVVTRVDEGQEFTVQAGPQASGAFQWYEVRAEDGSVQGWAASGNGLDRWLSPLE